MCLFVVCLFVCFRLLVCWCIVCDSLCLLLLLFVRAWLFVCAVCLYGLFFIRYIMPRALVFCCLFEVFGCLCGLFDLFVVVALVF